MKRLIMAHYDGYKKKTPLITRYLVVLLSAITSLMIFTTLVSAQDEPDKPLPESSSSLENGSTNLLDNGQNVSRGEKSNFQEFLGCISDSIQEGAEASIAERIVNTCFNSSYIEGDKTKQPSSERSGEDDESGDGLPALH